jgi:hypothetical protein
MTIGGFREGRDADGWRLSAALWKLKREEVGDLNRGIVEEEEIPDDVVAAPRLQEDVVALQRLLSVKVPPLKRARAKKTAKAFYGFETLLGVVLVLPFRSKEKFTTNMGSGSPRSPRSARQIGGS